MVLRSKPTLVLPPTLQHQMLEGDVDYWPALRAWLERSGRRDVNGTVDEYGRTLLFYAANAGRLDQNFRVRIQSNSCGPKIPVDHVHLARALIAYGADPNIRDNWYLLANGALLAPCRRWIGKCKWARPQNEFTRMG